MLHMKLRCYLNDKEKKNNYWKYFYVQQIYRKKYTKKEDERLRDNVWRSGCKATTSSSDRRRV